MIARHRQSARYDRQGVTLVEVLLTLCLLVVIASLVWPTLGKPFANQRLKKSADRIRAAWCEARVDAMDTGNVYVFLHAIEGERYRVERRADLAVTADASFDESAGQSNASGMPAVVERILPNGITFLSGEVEADTRATLLGAGNDVSSTSSAVDVDWSEPIIFYPDGTTSTAQLTMKNEHDRQIRLSLRGLTGVVRVNDVGSDEE